MSYPRRCWHTDREYEHRNVHAYIESQRPIYEKRLMKVKLDQLIDDLLCVFRLNILNCRIHKTGLLSLNNIECFRELSWSDMMVRGCGESTVADCDT